MTNAKDDARKKLGQLVEEFVETKAKVNLQGAPEATARSWIERFLMIFGWDSGNPRQVRQEYTIQGRAARRLQVEGIPHRRPDYCLIVSRRRALYIDAKKFEANIGDDPGIAYQVRSYGWSEGFRLSYAFDFNELAVYDCRAKPSPEDSAAVARVWYVRHESFVIEFDRLWDYFSREAIHEGSLERLHPAKSVPHGTLTLDADFENQLSGWRLQLATCIMRYGKTRNTELISAASQRILDRVIFLRMCEEFGLEPEGSLKEMGTNEDGFWARFLEEHERRWGKVYDGLLFPASYEDDPTGVDESVRSWDLRGRVFKDITANLYFPQPYRFDVVPIELLGGIYERYLGKRLRLVGNEISDEFKPEYQRTKGAIYTPAWVVDRVISATLDPMLTSRDPDGILQLRVVDPACGSGGFLLGVYDYLEDRILTWFHEHSRDTRRSSFVVTTGTGMRLVSRVVKAIITQCLYGVDIDPAAVEVTRMSLALRYLERVAADEPEVPEELLAGVGRNIRQGNSLVGSDIERLGLQSRADIAAIMPFDWDSKSTGFGEVMDEGGFDAVVGNPPYIEVKRYSKWMPEMYEYLRESGRYKTTAEGKTDIAIPFMEQGFRLLRDDGRLGFIIQNRFFKTEYGRLVRGWLSNRRIVETIQDFRDLQVFLGRTTYTAIMILRKDSPSIQYQCYQTIEDAQAQRSLVSTEIPWARVSDTPWSFDQPDLLEVYETLKEKLGTIESQRAFTISVGLQTLWGKIYQLDSVDVHPRTVTGRNGLGDEVTIERAALRPLCRNRGFYPFRQDNADAWVVFPYDIDNGDFYEIRWKDFEKRFPKAASYLKDNKRRIGKAVQMNHGANDWHLYKYPKNLVQQTRPKVLFPMTIEDTLATVDTVGDVYQDNVNINSLAFAGATPEQLLAVAAVFNSTAFNALAKLKAGLNAAGWRKFNKQFAEIVPFPRRMVEDPSKVDLLGAQAQRITELQEQARRAKGEGAVVAIRGALESLWAELDEIVEDAYELALSQRRIIRRYPRKFDRVELLLRQSDPPEDEDDE